MFRLPTHLESLIPTPSQQVPYGRPWRGSFFLPPSTPSSDGNRRELKCTAAETDGNNQVERWPAYFNVQILSQRPLLREVNDWIKANTPPMCVFMPDRLPDSAAHTANTAQFEAIAGALMQNQFVAIAPWNVPDRITGAGIILFPSGTSRNILVGALFLNSNFPDFIHNLNLLPRSLSYRPIPPGHPEAREANRATQLNPLITLISPTHASARVRLHEDLSKNYRHLPRLAPTCPHAD